MTGPATQQGQCLSSALRRGHLPQVTRQVWGRARVGSHPSRVTSLSRSPATFPIFTAAWRRVPCFPQTHGRKAGPVLTGG